MIQADMMRNKPLVPTALKPVKGSLSPHYKGKKQMKRYANQLRDHTARAALMIAKADVASIMEQ